MSVKLLDPKNDTVFKMLFARKGNEDILSDLITAILTLKVPIKDLKVLNPEIPKDHIDDKGIVLDIAVELEDGRRINIEMQVNWQHHLIKRAYFYASKLYSSQLNVGGAYSSLKKCISIFLMKSPIFRDAPENSFHYIFEMKERGDQAEIEGLLEIQFIEISKIFNVLEIEPDDDGKLPLVDWCQFLYNPNDFTTRGKGASHLSAIDKARRALQELSEDPEAQEIARLREKAMLDYASNLEAVKEEGRKQGQEEGRKQGQKDASYQFLHHLLADPETKDLSIAKLAELTNLTPEEVQAEMKLIR